MGVSLEHHDDGFGFRGGASVPWLPLALAAVSGVLTLPLLGLTCFALVVFRGDWMLGDVWKSPCLVVPSVLGVVTTAILAAVATRTHPSVDLLVTGAELELWVDDVYEIIDLSGADIRPSKDTIIVETHLECLSIPTDLLDKEHAAKLAKLLQQAAHPSLEANPDDLLPVPSPPAPVPRDTGPPSEPDPEGET